MTVLLRRLSLIVLSLALVSLGAGPASSQAPTRGHGAEAHDMELVGHDDLQGRSAYQPTIHQQRGRVIAYVGHHGGRARNPLTGAEEDNGTSIVDVTDPGRPRYLAHIPGLPGGPEQGGAQMARVCNRQGKTYLLRTFGNNAPGAGHEAWDVTDPLKRFHSMHPRWNPDFVRGLIRFAFTREARASAPAENPAHTTAAQAASSRRIRCSSGRRGGARGA